MMISFQCFCGNEQVKETLAYEGFLGYEAVICKKCGCYFDHFGSHKADDWSRAMLIDHKDKSKVSA